MDYKGIAIGGAWIVSGVFAGLVAPIVIGIVAFGKSEAIGQGIQMLMWAFVSVPIGLIIGMVMASRSWEKRHPPVNN